MRPDLILPFPRSQRGSNGADQRRDLQRTFEQRDVAQDAHGVRGVCRVRARTRHHENWQIRPRRLLGEHAQQIDLGAGDRLLRKQHDTHTPTQLAHHRRHRVNGVAGNPRLREQLTGDGTVARGRRQQQHASIADRLGVVSHSLTSDACP